MCNKEDEGCEGIQLSTNGVITVEELKQREIKEYVMV